MKVIHDIKTPLLSIKQIINSNATGQDEVTNSNSNNLLSVMGDSNTENEQLKLSNQFSCQQSM